MTILPVMGQIEGRLTRAAATLGADAGQTFWRLYLPLTMPGAAAGAACVHRHGRVPHHARHPEWRLQRDALGLAEALDGEEGKLCRNVEVKVLTDKEATALAVKKALPWLRRRRRRGQDDISDVLYEGRAASLRTQRSHFGPKQRRRPWRGRSRRCTPGHNRAIAHADL